MCPGIPQRFLDKIQQFQVRLPLVIACGGLLLGGPGVSAAQHKPNEKVSAPSSVADSQIKAGTNGPAYFDVRAYVVEGDKSLTTNLPASLFSKHTGTNLNVADIIQAAFEVQLECRDRGYSNVCVAIAAHRITNGIVSLDVFRAPISQVLVSGRRYVVGEEVAGTVPATQGARTGTNATSSSAGTNSGPRFNVKAFAVAGDTLLSDAALTAVLGKYTGTNVGVNDIVKAASELQAEYRERGFPTVSVTIPQQQITNEMVRIQVFEGRLSDINVTGNRFFNSNNIMRALPSLRTNIILNGAVFQAELDRANANQDRQIYPQIEPGPEPNTTALDLKVKDQLPLHGKIDLDNQSSPGTPALRINSSAVYNNLWQHEQSLGLQYSFSPEDYKSGENWRILDRPLVANYSGFYRIPLGSPEAVADTVAAKPGTFGYDEGTRKFQLPASSSQPELNFYASRSAIETSVTTLLSTNLYNTNGNSLDRKDAQQDITINQDLGMRFSLPIATSANFKSALSGGLDYKGYELQSYKTNTFTLTSIVIDDTSNPGHPITNVNVSVINSPVPPPNGLTESKLDYLPLATRYDASLNDRLGVTSFGLGLSANTWHSGSTSNLHTIAGSTISSGYWVILTPSISRDFLINTNWTLSLRADGQWASQPLISNEQFGAGGVNSVRGYREGDVFGDFGWHVSIEQKTPGYVVGMVGGTQPLTIRGSIFMDFADVYLIDPQGRESPTPLWGTGFGFVAAVGFHWEARLIFGWPLLTTPDTSAGQPRFNFSLTAQF